jgi:undecaprenyl-diphosphatase
MPGLSDRRLALIVAALAALWLSMLLLGGPGSAADAALLRAAQLPALVPAARLLTRLGDWYILLPLSLAASGLLLLRRGLRGAAFFLVLILAGRLAVEAQKAWFGRPRPDLHDHLVTTHNMAFPSGHAAYSMMFWLGLALFAVADRRLRGPAVALALLLSGMTGLTRLILAVHWPSDVIGGWAFGAAWTLLLARLAAAGERMPPSVIVPAKESDMNDRSRPDDSELIDEMEEAPGQGGTSGGDLQRDVATQAEEDDIVGDGGITRVTGEDKPRKGDRPNLPNRD